MVDPAEQLSSTARGAVTARFDALRRTSGGGPAMFLASAADPECASWCVARFSCNARALHQAGCLPLPVSVL